MTLPNSFVNNVKKRRKERKRSDKSIPLQAGVAKAVLNLLRASSPSGQQVGSRLVQHQEVHMAARAMKDKTTKLCEKV